MNQHLAGERAMDCIGEKVWVKSETPNGEPTLGVVIEERLEEHENLLVEFPKGERLLVNIQDVEFTGVLQDVDRDQT